MTVSHDKQTATDCNRYNSPTLNIACLHTSWLLWQFQHIADLNESTTFLFTPKFHRSLCEINNTRHNWNNLMLTIYGDNWIYVHTHRCTIWCDGCLFMAVFSFAITRVPVYTAISNFENSCSQRFEVEVVLNSTNYSCLLRGRMAHCYE